MSYSYYLLLTSLLSWKTICWFWFVDIGYYPNGQMTDSPRSPWLMAAMRHLSMAVRKLGSPKDSREMSWKAAVSHPLPPDRKTFGGISDFRICEDTYHIQYHILDWQVLLWYILVPSLIIYWYQPLKNNDLAISSRTKLCRCNWILRARCSWQVGRCHLANSTCLWYYVHIKSSHILSLYGCTRDGSQEAKILSTLSSCFKFPTGSSREILRVSHALHSYQSFCAIFIGDSDNHMDSIGQGENGWWQKASGKRTPYTASQHNYSHWYSLKLWKIKEPTVHSRKSRWRDGRLGQLVCFAVLPLGLGCQCHPSQPPCLPVVRSAW